MHPNRRVRYAAVLTLTFDGTTDLGVSVTVVLRG